MALNSKLIDAIETYFDHVDPKRLSTDQMALLLVAHRLEELGNTVAGDLSVVVIPD